MSIFQQRQRATHAEKKVLGVLLNGSKRWKQLLDETGLSRQGLLNALESLVKNDLIEQMPRKEKRVSYGRTPTTYTILHDPAFIRQMIADSEVIGQDRYRHLKGLVERVLKQESNQYKQYLMLLDLFTGWSNADLKWVQNQMIWAAVALLGRDFVTFRDLLKITDETYRKCGRYLFEASRKHPVAALALIDSAEDEDISDVLDEHYDFSNLPSRNEILGEALKPLRQHELPSFEDLSKGAEQTKRGKSFAKPGEYPIRTEKQIRKILAYINTRKTTAYRRSEVTD